MIGPRRSLAGVRVPPAKEAALPDDKAGVGEGIIAAAGIWHCAVLLRRRSGRAFFVASVRLVRALHPWHIGCSRVRWA